MNDDFWDDLLAHIRQRVLVPVVGPDVTVVESDKADQTFSTLIGERLVERWDLSVSSGPTTMDEAVAAFVRERGQDEIERLYRVINDIIVEVDPEPADAMRDLAAIDDLRMFVSTTPDRVLAKAINEVRFRGRPVTRELSFSPNQSTSEQSRNAQPASASDTVVLNLFGQAASTPQYAIHEEDRLEWMHALLSDRASLPDWVSYQLKEHPLLYIGCEIPDWLGRFLLRMSQQQPVVDGTHTVLLGRLLSFPRTVAFKLLHHVLPQDSGATAGHGTHRVRRGIACALAETGQRETTRGGSARCRATDPGHTDDLHQLHAGGRGRRPTGVRRDNESRR